MTSAPATSAHPTLEAIIPCAWHNAITDAGGELYEVGGAVRDALLARPVKDRDYLVTGLPFERLQQTLRAHGKVSLVGKSFGVLKFQPNNTDANNEAACSASKERREPPVIDIAIPRTEVSTGDGHRDFDVSYDHTLSVEDDLRRRDFTINAIARHVGTGTLVDPHNGVVDIAARCIRQVFPNTFAEDPLRLLRAVQFAARLQFEIEETTKQAMTTHAQRIRTVSAERIAEELAKLLSARRPSDGFHLMAETGILAHAFPELERCRETPQDKLAGDTVFHHTMRVLDAAADDDYIVHQGDIHLLLAALYHDVGKPKTMRYDEAANRITFFGHQLVSRGIAKRRMRELKIETIGVDPKIVCRLVEHHMFETKASYTDRAIRRFVHKIGEDILWLLMDLRLADNRGGKYPNGIKGVMRLRSRIKEELAKRPAFTAKDLVLNGHDLMQLGVPAGPQMGTIIKRLVEACVDDPECNTREGLLALIQEHAPSQPNSA